MFAVGEIWANKKANNESGKLQNWWNGKENEAAAALRGTQSEFQ